MCRKGMKRLILISLFVCSNLLSIAQYNTTFFEDTTQRITFALETNFNYGSTVMNTELLNKFIFGGHIDRSKKNDAFDNLSGNNILGGDLEYHINATIPFDTLLGKTDLSLVLGVAQKEHVDSRFTSDLFRFILDGNKQFAGKTIDVGNTNVNYFKYQQFNVGLIKHKKKNGKMALQGGIVSLIKSQEKFYIDVPKGSLFTEAFGREIDLFVDYTHITSDTSNSGFSAFNGYGVASEFFTQFYLKNGDKINLNVKDLGFIYWNKNSINFSANQTFQFDGLAVDNIFDLNDSLLNNISSDTIIENLTERSDKREVTNFLPTSFNADYTKYINQKWQINGGIYYRMLVNYFPLFYTNTSYAVTNNFITRVHISYGGYGKLNAGLALASKIKNNYTVFVGSNNLDAFISPSDSFSTSGFVGLTVQF